MEWLLSCMNEDGANSYIPLSKQFGAESAMKRSTLRLLSLLAILALFSVWAFGQTETGQITGTIRDASGAVVSGAKVTVKSVNTGATRETTTNSSGIFTVTNLRPDTFEVTIESAGFQKVTHQVQVMVGALTDVSTQLKVSGAATTVEVTGSGESSTVNTENATMSQAITSQQVNELPTLTRNPYDLVGTAGNVTEDTNSGRGAGYTINGQRSASTDILLDGGQNVDLFTASVGQQVPLDSVQEFSVLTNNFAAEYGRASGGIVNVVTKSGTNAFHGSAYEYNRVSALSSNTYNNNANDIKKGIFTRNQFGFAIGGPIVKNKLFFFSNTEWIRVRSNSPQTYNIVDPSFLALTAPATQTFYNAYGKLAPGVRTLGTVSWGAASGGQCPAGIPCATTFADTVVVPVPADAGGGSPENTWETVERVDYNLSDKTTMFGRYASYKELDFPGTVAASAYAGYNTGDSTYDQNVTYSLTHVFTPSLVDTFKLVYNRINGPVDTLGTAPIGPTLYSTSGVPPLADTGFPLIFPGYLPTSPGQAIPFGGPQNVYQLIDDLSWSKGKHQFKFGGDLIWLRDNRVFGAYENAVEALGTTFTCTPGHPKCSPSLANLVTGNIYQFQGAIYPQGKYPCYRDINTGAAIVTPDCTLQLPVGPPAFNRNYRYNDGAVYGQDSWKVSQRLTLNLGLRWEYYGVQHNANQALDSNFVLGPGSTIFDQIRNGSVKLASQGGVFWKPDYDNFGPRVGFAYDLFGDGTTSIRGGYGISYERNFGNVTFNTIQNPPNYGVVSLIAGIPGADLSSAPIYTNNSGPLAGTGTKALPAVSQRAIDQNLATAYAQTWDFSVQRQLMKNSVLAVDYAGSKGSNLYSISNINQIDAGGTYLGDANVNNRLNLQYSNMNYRASNAYSNYNALNVRWSSTNLLNKGLSLTANYTWSHSQDNLSSTFTDQFGATASGYYTLGYTDAFNPKLDYGNSDFDVRNRFIVSGTWDLPWMKNASNAVARQVLGGWSMGSIINIRSGIPYSIYDSTNGFASDSPRWIPGGPVSGSGGANSSTLVGPNTFNYLPLPTNPDGSIAGLGNSLAVPNCTGLYHTGCTYSLNGQGVPARNGFQGPGYWNINMNFYKNFKLTERFTMQFRGEFYNIFNHSNMYINGLNLDAAGLTSPYIQSEKGGVINYAGNPSDERRNIQFALKLLF
jgi:outer membrane receptor protein involved in Fe transport